jgi:hypothetical protein
MQQTLRWRRRSLRLLIVTIVEVVAETESDQTKTAVYIWGDLYEPRTTGPIIDCCRLSGRCAKKLILIAQLHTLFNFVWRSRICLLSN